MDIFDQVAAEQNGDIFDQVAAEQRSKRPTSGPRYRGVGGSWQEDKPLSILEQRRREQEFGTYKEVNDSSAGEELVKEIGRAHV